MNLSHFLLNSDYPMDKIVYFYEFNDTVPERSADFTTQHYEKVIDLQNGDMPLIMGIWATKSDFRDPRPFYSGTTLYRQEIDLGHSFELVQMENPNRVKIVQTDMSRASTPIFVRLYGVPKVGALKKYASTQNKAKRMLFNSDYTYLPIIFAAKFEMDSLPTSGSKRVNAAHGYKELISNVDYATLVIDYPESVYFPSVRLWMVDSVGNIIDDPQAGFEHGNSQIPRAKIEIDTEAHTITVHFDEMVSLYGGSYRKVYMRVWGDNGPE